MAESEPELSELRERLIGDWVRVRDVFEEWDEDGSGTIDRVEWLHAVGSLCGMLPDAAGRLYDLLDADGNGSLDYKELNKELRRGASVELDAALQDGALGEIETESKNKHSLRKDGPQTTRSRVITLEMGVGATVPPNTVCFGAAIDACARAGRWERSLALLEQMRSRGVPPSVFCYNAAISACDRAGLADVAVGVLEDMVVRTCNGR